MSTYESGTTHTHGPWTTTPQTFSYSLVNSVGNDRALFVFICWEDARTDTIPTSVTYGGQALTKIADVINNDTFKCGTQVWWIGDADLPNGNGSNTVSVQFASNGHGSSSQAEYIVLEYSGAGQSAPDNIESATYVNPAVDDLSLTVTPDDADTIVIGAMTTGYVANVVGQTGTLRFEVDGTSSTGAAAEYQNSGSGAVDMEITLNGTGTRASFVALELPNAATIPDLDSVGVGVGVGTLTLDADLPAVGVGAGVGALTLDASLDPVGVGAAVGLLELDQDLDVVAIGVAVAELELDADLDAVGVGVGVGTLIDPETPTALHRINCGSAATPYEDSNGDIWDVDRDFGAGTNTYTPGAVPIGGTIDDTLYQTSRGVVAAGGTPTPYGITYTLSVPPDTDLLIRAHFAELFFTSVGARLLNVVIDGVTQPGGPIDIFDEVGHDHALVREYSVTSTGETITIKFENAGADKATINALEVLTAASGPAELDAVGVGVGVGTLELAQDLDAVGVGAGVGALELDASLDPVGAGVGVGELTLDASLDPVGVGAGVGALELDADLDSVGVGVGVGTLVSTEDPPDDLSLEVSGITQFTAAVGGSPTPSGFTITVTNHSDSAIRFEAKACCDWLMLTDYYGSLDPDESIMIGVIADTDELAEGIYSALVCVCSRESHDHAFLAVPVRAEIGTPATAVATRYIDYDTGNDSNDGLTEGAPWKHLPMDANATGNAASHSEAAGHEFILKGGVHYRGRLVLGADGSLGQRIIVDGNTRGTWGDGPAVIDGSQPIGGWVDNLDGTFTADISAAQWFDKTALGLRPFDGDQLMTAAQWPVKQPEKFRYDDMTTWQVPDSVAPGTCTWSGFAALPAGWENDDVYLYGWKSDNRVAVTKVTGFDSGTNTVSFTPSFTWTSSQTPRFVLVNSPHFLTDPGEFVIDETAEEITAIPYGSNPDDITGSTVAELVDMLGDYWHLRGVILQRAGGSADFQGSAIANFTSTSQHTRIEGCQIRWCPSQRGTIDFRGTHTGTIIEGCALYQNILGRDIQIVNGDGGTGQQDGLIRHNVLFASGGTGIFSNVCNGVEVDQNLIVRNLAVHANGVSLYEGTYDGRITRNRIVEGNIAISIQINSDTYGGENCLVAHNFGDLKASFLGFGSTMAIYSLSQSAGIQIFNNTFINPYGQALSLGTHAEYSQPLLGLEIRNNILEGANGGVNPSAGLGITTSNNHFLAEWDSSYPYDATDLMETDKSVIFADHLNGDYTLAPGSPCIDTGYDTGLTLVPAVGQRDRGAFEYSQSTTLDSVGVGIGVGELVLVQDLDAVGIGIGVGTLTEDSGLDLDAVGIGVGVGTLELVQDLDSVGLGIGVGALELVQELDAVGIGAGVGALELEESLDAVGVGIGVGTLQVADPESDGDLDAVGLGVGVGELVLVQDLDAVGIGIGISELSLEEVPDVTTNAWYWCLQDEHLAEDIYWQAPGYPERQIRAVVTREHDHVVQGRANRRGVRVMVLNHPIHGVAVFKNRDEYFFRARFYENGPYLRFRVQRSLTGGAGGFWEFEGVSVG